MFVDLFFFFSYLISVVVSLFIIALFWWKKRDTVETLDDIILFIDVFISVGNRN